MAGSLNRVMLIGRLTRDPELRYTPSGTAVCNLALATNRYGSDPATGERKEFTDYHDVVVWNQGTRKLAETTAQYLQKGRLVYVEGRLQTRSWDDAQSGQKRYKTEVNANDVQFLDSAGRQEGAPSGDSAAARFRVTVPCAVATSIPMTFRSEAGEPCLISTAAAARSAASAWSTSTSSTTRRSRGCAATCPSGARSCRGA